MAYTLPNFAPINPVQPNLNLSNSGSPVVNDITSVLSLAENLFGKPAYNPNPPNSPQLIGLSAAAWMNFVRNLPQFRGANLQQNSSGVVYANGQVVPTTYYSMASGSGALTSSLSSMFTNPQTGGLNYMTIGIAAVGAFLLYKTLKK